jgi:hypothetical protein
MGSTTKYTIEEKEAIMQSFKDAEARAMSKIKARMIKLSKDKKFMKELEKEVYENLNQRPKK